MKTKFTSINAEERITYINRLNSIIIFNNNINKAILRLSKAAPTQAPCK